MVARLAEIPQEEIHDTFRVEEKLGKLGLISKAMILGVLVWGTWPKPVSVSISLSWTEDCDGHAKPIT